MIGFEIPEYLKMIHDNLMKILLINFLSNMLIIRGNNVVPGVREQQSDVRRWCFQSLSSIFWENHEDAIAVLEHSRKHDGTISK